jgi:hypothetical protein
MKRYVKVGRMGGLAALLCGLCLVASAAPALAAPCPPGSTDPLYCAKLISQVKQIRKSTLEIESSYHSIVASTKKILKRVHTASIISQVNALLAKGAKLDADKIRLLKTALSQKSVYVQRATVAMARQDIAIARVYAAQARVIAAIALVTGG